MQELNEEIVLLRLLTAEPAIPRRHILDGEDTVLSLSDNTDHVLSLLDERDVVDSLAFLSATSGEPEKVTAICLEECLQPESCIILIAMNTTKFNDLVVNFSRIARILETANRKSELSRVITKMP